MLRNRSVPSRVFALLLWSTDPPAYLQTTTEGVDKLAPRPLVNRGNTNVAEAAMLPADDIENRGRELIDHRCLEINKQVKRF